MRSNICFVFSVGFSHNSVLNRRSIVDESLVARAFLILSVKDFSLIISHTFANLGQIV